MEFFVDELIDEVLLFSMPLSKAFPELSQKEREEKALFLVKVELMKVIKPRYWLEVFSTIEITDTCAFIY